jgi:GT2 family glycosyltransferase
MRCSIIILSHGRPDLTVECVRSLAETTDTREAEIIVFDNGSPTKDLEVLQAELEHPAAKLISGARNWGFAGGSNRAAAAASGTILVFLNNDITALPGWLDPLADALGEKDTAIAGSLLLYPSGRVQHAGIGLGLWGLPLNLGVNRPPEEFQGRLASLGTTGACMAITADMFARLGGFDEAYFFSYEDVDLCMRAGSRGLRTVVRCDSKLIHHESATSLAGPVHKLRSEAEEVFLTRWQGKIETFIAREFRKLESLGIRTAAIFGTGRAGLRMLVNIRALSKLEAIAFVDSRPEMTGKVVSGLPVYLPQDIPGTVDAVLAASMYIDELQQEAAEAGICDRFIATVFRNPGPSLFG